jgi:hypothetical protein
MSEYQRYEWMTSDRPLTDDVPAQLWDAEAIVRIRQEADTLLVRWLFGPPGLHIRDYVGRTAPGVPAITPLKSKESEDGETRLVPAA